MLSAEEARIKEGDMHRWMVIRGMLGVLMFVFSAVPVVAALQEEGPTLAPLTSVRMESIFSTELDGPILVCHRLFESWNRWHDTCQSLVASPYYSEYSAGDEVEGVLYDGFFYSRRNDETTWAVLPASAIYNSTLSLTEGLFDIPFEAAITNLGSVTLGDIPTTQYQYWSIDDEYNQFLGNNQPVSDFFVAADGRVIQDQASLRSRNTLTQVRGYSQHNAPITVAAPPSDLLEERKRVIINPR